MRARAHDDARAARPHTALFLILTARYSYYNCGLVAVSIHREKNSRAFQRFRRKTNVKWRRELHKAEKNRQREEDEKLIAAYRAKRAGGGKAKTAVVDDSESEGAYPLQTPTRKVEAQEWKKPLAKQRAPSTASASSDE